MQASFSAHDVDELVAELDPQLTTFLSLDGNEQRLTLPSQVCEGWMYRLTLHPGMELRIQNLSIQDSFSISTEYRGERTPLELGLCVSGCVKGMLCDSGTEIDFSVGKSFLGFASDSRRVVEYARNQQLTAISISIEPETFQILLGSQVEQLPLLLQQVISEQVTTPYTHACPIPAAMQTAIQQVLNCPYQGLTKRLYLESRAIELIALYLEQIISKNEPKNQQLSLSNDTVERIYHAKEILLKRFNYPPSLAQLAKQVGLNDCTLKLGFRQVFGTTVFGCLHHYRMEQAHLLLQTGSLNVTKVAEAVGYASLGSFNTAFKKRFGVNPSAVRRG